MQEFRNFVLGLERLDLEWFVDLLDNVSLQNPPVRNRVEHPRSTPT